MLSVSLFYICSYSIRHVDVVVHIHELYITLSNRYFLDMYMSLYEEHQRLICIQYKYIFNFEIFKLHKSQVIKNYMESFQYRKRKEEMRVDLTMLRLIEEK